MPDTMRPHRDRSKSPASTHFAVRVAEQLRRIAAWLEQGQAERVIVTLSDQTPLLITRIESFERLPERWNGHGGGPIDKRVRQDAIGFLRKLTANYGISVPAPTAIDPTSDRGVAIEWKVDGPPQKIEIIFLPDGGNEYTVRDLTADRLQHGAEGAAEDALLQLVKTSVVNRPLLSP